MQRSHWLISNPLIGRPLGPALILVSTLATLLVGPIVAAGESAAQGTIERLPDGWQIGPTEDSIYFPVASAVLDDHGLRILRRHIAKLDAFPHLYITLVAHTDELGSAALEIAIAQDRLTAVQRVLEEARIPTRRVRTINLAGEDRPVTECSNQDCYRTRRRIDVIFHR